MSTTVQNFTMPQTAYYELRSGDITYRCVYKTISFYAIDREICVKETKRRLKFLREELEKLADGNFATILWRLKPFYQFKPDLDGGMWVCRMRFATSPLLTPEVEEQLGFVLEGETIPLLRG